LICMLCYGVHHHCRGGDVHEAFTADGDCEDFPQWPLNSGRIHSNMVHQWSHQTHGRRYRVLLPFLTWPR
jgi:hypothetical protein